MPSLVFFSIVEKQYLHGPKIKREREREVLHMLHTDFFLRKRITINIHHIITSLQKSGSNIICIIQLWKK